MKRTLLTCCALILFSAPIFSQTNYSNSPREIELHRINNLKSGVKSDEGVFNRLTFTYEDFSLFEKNAAEIEKLLPATMQIEKITILESNKSCEIIYALPAASTNDFLKVYKETIGKFGILMYNYQEEVIITASN